MSKLCNFSTWIDSKLKIDAVLNITNDSELEEDWMWLNENTFELHGFYQAKTLKYVCEVFRQKWIYHEKSSKKEGQSNKFNQFSDFEHASPIIVQIFDKLSMIVDKK